MRFSIRALLLIPLLVMIGFLAHDQALHWHHSRIEPLLYAHILTTELNPRTTYKFVIGHPVDANWKEPSFSQISGFAAPNTRPFGDVNAVVFFVDRVEWTGWNSVSIDYGTYSSSNECSGTDRARFRYANEAWENISSGSEWITTDDACQF